MSLVSYREIFGIFLLQTFNTASDMYIRLHTYENV